MAVVSVRMVSLIFWPWAGLADDLQPETGSAFLHLDGREGDIEGPVGKKQIGEMRKAFRTPVVKMRLDDLDVLAFLDCPGGPDDETQEIWLVVGKQMTAGSVAGGSGCHGRQRAELIGQNFQQGGTGRGHQFLGVMDPIGRDAVEQLADRRGRQRQPAVGAVDKAAAQGQRRGNQALDAKLAQADDDPDHIDDGVEGANFMEMHPVDFDGMDLGLGLGQGPEDGCGRAGDVVGQRALVEDCQEIGQGPQLLVCCGGYFELGRPYALTCGAEMSSVNGGRSRRASSCRRVAGETPASIRAARNMSPLIPEKQSA